MFNRSEYFISIKGFPIALNRNIFQLFKCCYLQTKTNHDSRPGEKNDRI